MSNNENMTYGLVEQVSPLIRRVVAANPSPFTLNGTGSYLIGHGKVCLIDPGPQIAAHIEALLRAIRGEQLTHILITHTHLDHSPAAAAVKQMTDATTYSYGPHGSRHDIESNAEEGVDFDFVPEVLLSDKDVIHGGDWTLEAIHTPGHTSNHLCFVLHEESALFSGDHVMGWSTTVVSPPDGHMGSYIESLEKLMGRNDEIYWPTHGAFIRQPQKYVHSLIKHRQARELQILDCIKSDVRTVSDIVAIIYREVPTVLHYAAGRSVLAHLIHLWEQGLVVCDGIPSENKLFKMP